MTCRSVRGRWLVSSHELAASRERAPKSGARCTETPSGVSEGDAFACVCCCAVWPGGPAPAPSDTFQSSAASPFAVVVLLLVLLLLLRRVHPSAAARGELARNGSLPAPAGARASGRPPRLRGSAGPSAMLRRRATRALAARTDFERRRTVSAADACRNCGGSCSNCAPRLSEPRGERLEAAHASENRSGGWANVAAPR
jgi:hypothetical protein